MTLDRCGTLKKLEFDVEPNEPASRGRCTTNPLLRLWELLPMKVRRKDGRSASRHGRT